jgi:hypothetical protein
VQRWYPHRCRDPRDAGRDHADMGSPWLIIVAKDDDIEPGKVFREFLAPLARAVRACDGRQPPLRQPVAVFFAFANVDPGRVSIALCDGREQFGKFVQDAADTVDRAAPFDPPAFAVWPARRENLLVADNDPADLEQ